MDFISLFKQGFYEIYLGSRKNQLVSVLWPLLLHGCTKETILKIIDDQIIPLHILVSSGLKEPILVQGWDWKLDIFGVQFSAGHFT
jgi:hypothetical protein